MELESMNPTVSGHLEAAVVALVYLCASRVVVAVERVGLGPLCWQLVAEVVVELRFHYLALGAEVERLNLA